MKFYVKAVAHALLYAQAVCPIVDHKHDAVSAVMRRSHCLDKDVSKSDRFAGSEMAKVANLPQSISTRSPVRCCGDIDREVELPMINAHVARVIGVVV